ncbi:SseB family protein [Lacisediminihabitans profunda]|uniref:SseB family protein n=1 Tax=Lacisediminihabitans profunda TaxID=2594790 RepID=A0A5C8URH1_9MICO|nr:SseB family protein [Lacisediminihabitans profunda]TXN31181.1 SseB family protein [Lacisediminihabitans profunda]
MDEVREATELERMIVLAQADRATGEAVLRVFADSRVVIPSGTPVSTNLGQLQPLLFDNNGASMLAAFTHADQIGDFAELAAFSLTITGRLLLVAMPPGAGLVLNPSRSIGLELPPEAIRLFVRDILEQASAAEE